MRRCLSFVAGCIAYDSDRIMFLRSLTQPQRASSDGVPAEPGGQVRMVGRLPATGFGLIYLDYATQGCMPVGSASLYRDMIARNAVV